MAAPFTPDRAVLAAVVTATAVLFLPAAADPVNVVKLSVAVLAALAVAALAAVRAVRTRLVNVPAGPAGLAAGLLLTAFCAATVAAPVTHIAVVGTYGRNSGLLAYGSALLLFLAAVRVLGADTARWLAYGVLAAGAFTAAYGLLQRAGGDPINWANPYNPVIASMGNPDFASGYLGICVPVAVWGALHASWAGVWRGVCALLALAALGTAVLSDAVQGPLAAAGGLLVVGVAWSLEAPHRWRRLGLASAAALAAAGAGVLALGLASFGPAASFFSGGSWQARRWYWDAALTMFRHHPVFGIGLDHYGIGWRTDRPRASVAGQGSAAFSDAAHSVPLQMLAQGGALLALAYLVFVAVVAVALVRGLQRTAGADRLLLGGLGGGWVAYQVQSLVSIDQVPLIVANYLLAAGVVAVAGAAGLRELRLPGAPVPASESATRRRQRAAVVLEREATGADYALAGVVVLAALVVGWLSLGPLRANMAVHSGDVTLAAGDGNGAYDDYRHAADVASSVSEYWFKQARFLNQVKQPALALTAFESGIEHNDRDPSALREAALVAEGLGRVDQARGWLDRARAVSPYDTDVLLAAATFELRHRGAPKAKDLLERAVDDLPAPASLWAALGDARAVLGDPAGAREAYEQALKIQPGEPTATAGMAKLDSAKG